MKNTGALVRKIFLLLLVIGLSYAAFAQTDQASWANLSGLRPGQKIQVIGVPSKKHSGTFVSASDAAISYRETTGEQSIPKQEVPSVKLMENKHRLRNTLIVAGVGAGVGAGIGAALHKSCSSQSFCLDIGGAALPAGIGAVLGGVGGAVVGVLLPSHNTHKWRKALTGGKPLTIVCPWQNDTIHPKSLSPLNPDTDSPREGAKRLKMIAWVYWKISSTPFLVDGVSWSSLAGDALRSAQAVALWPSGLQSGWDRAAKWWRRT
jgi:hypothetical protein